MIVKFFTLLFIIIHLCSCSLKSRDDISSSPMQGTVDIFKTSKIKPKINPSEEKVGPHPEDKEPQYFDVKKRKPVVSLHIGAGLNRSLVSLKILSLLEREGIRPSILSGSEMGAVIAAMYANNFTTKEIEWRFFKFFEKTKSEKYFSQKWLSVMGEQLIDPLKKERMEHLKKIMVLPVFEKDDKRVVYLKKGDIHKLIYSSVVPRGYGSYLPSYQWEFLDESKLNELGADIIISINFLNDDMSFNFTDEYLVGSYGKGYTSFEVNKDKLTNNLSLDLKEIKIGENSLDYRLSDNEIKKIETFIDAIKIKYTNLVKGM